jgi:hypothetical protein
MMTWLKWLIAGREMAELERWRSTALDARRWFSEFRDVAEALDYVRQQATGEGPQEFIDVVRRRMRDRRDAALVARAVGGVKALDLYEMARVRSANPDCHACNLEAMPATAAGVTVRPPRGKRRRGGV